MDDKARFYDPTLGRFIQPDTIIPGPANPQTWNRYTYVTNNPIGLVDPTGHIGITQPNAPCEDSSVGCRAGKGNGGFGGLGDSRRKDKGERDSVRASGGATNTEVQNGGERTKFLPIFSQADLAAYNIGTSAEETYTGTVVPELEPSFMRQGAYILTAAANGTSIAEDFSTSSKPGPSFATVTVEWEQHEAGIFIRNLLLKNSSPTMLTANQVDVFSPGRGSNGMTLAGASRPVSPNQSLSVPIGKYVAGDRTTTFSLYMSVHGGKPSTIAFTFVMPPGGSLPPGCALPFP